jgi:hypothetical protein
LARADAEDFEGEADDDAFEAFADAAVTVEALAVEAFAGMAVTVEAFAVEAFAGVAMTVEAFAVEAFAGMAVTVEAFAVEAFAGMAVTVEALEVEVAAGSVTTQSAADQPGVKAPDFWAANTCRPSCSTTRRNVSRLNLSWAARLRFSAAAAKLELPALSRHTNSRTP